MTEAKITALAPWFGAKRNLAAEIVREIGDHRVYWEPFCGSMSVLLAKPPCIMETVNDLHGDLINLARVIQDERLGSQLYRRLRRTLMSDVLHSEAAARYHANGYGLDMKPDVDRAYDYFLCAWLGRNGVAGTGSYNQGFCVRYTANGGHALGRLRHGLLSGWRITADGIALVESWGVPPKPSGAELLQWFKAKLARAENAMLDALAQAYPERLTGQELSEACGYSFGSSTFNNAIGKLRTLEAAEGYERDGGTKAADVFFE